MDAAIRFAGPATGSVDCPEFRTLRGPRTRVPRAYRRSDFDVTDTVQVSSPAAVREAVLQLYTAQHFDPRHIGKGGVALRPFGGLALETMTFSNAINLPGFPSPILRPGERYRHSLQWRIGS